jgi:hypothetical protein
MRTKIVAPPTRTSTSAAPACFAARIARAMSAWVTAAGRRLMRRFDGEIRGFPDCRPEGGHLTRRCHATDGLDRARDRALAKRPC